MSLQFRSRCAIASAALLVFATAGMAEEATTTYLPAIEPASDAAERAITGFRVPRGMKLELVAAEPLLANPVAFTFDEQGRIYVAETFRQGKGVEDNRGHMDWLDDDLAANTVADRSAYFQKHRQEKLEEYTREHDRIRLLDDRDGDGRMDSSTVFADGFNGALEGTGSGLLARDGNVYYTCIPKLWMLRDDNSDGVADQRRSLHDGYGVRVAFRGHDLHGLTWGPDGKLYYSIGDRGLNVTHEGQTHAYPDRGAVLRCNPDGSELEVIAIGLRNPQELAFDDYGNLFTGDNNSDSGDRARWVYVVEGGDSGWRMDYQYLRDRGPWNREKLWHPQWAGQPAYIVPPIINFADGPSGLTYYPGTGLGEQFRGHFFLADFRGTPGNSGIRTFKVAPTGASFELVEPSEFLWSILATDCDFGPDGGFYVSDWVEGWTGVGRGRMYRLSSNDDSQNEIMAETRKLIGDGMAGRSSDELLALLAHPDRRVRQNAQFELAERGVPSIDGLLAVAKANSNQLARLHAIWGLGQIGRKQGDALVGVIELLADEDAEVRSQAARVLGDAKVQDAFKPLVERLTDDSLRVRFLAAQSLAKLGRKEAIEPVLAMLRDNNDEDIYLRHAGVMALAGSGSPADLLKFAADDSAAARMGVLLAMRRHAAPEISQFLTDSDSRLVEEAARAIHDLPISAAMPALAELISSPGLSDPTLHRVLNAQFRAGQSENAVAVARCASKSGIGAALATEALRMLGDWAKPSGRDRVLGSWRPVGERDEDIAVEALRDALSSLLTASDEVRNEAVQVASRLGIREVAPVLVELVKDSSRTSESRAEALRALGQLGGNRLSDVLQASLSDSQAAVRAEALRVLAKSEPAKVVERAEKILDNGTVLERQTAIELLALSKSSEAEKHLAGTIDLLAAGKLPAELHLDVITAVEQSSLKNLQEQLARAQHGSSDDPLAAFRPALAGGDARRGEKIFFERAEVSCVRCHKIGSNGGDVGPDLSKVAADRQRDYLLESLVDPNRQIAKGFDSVTLLLDDGRVVSGVLRAEDTSSLRIVTPEGQPITIARDTIEDRATGKSAMPEDIVKKLTKHELRDLVEYLSTLR